MIVDKAGLYDAQKDGEVSDRRRSFIHRSCSSPACLPSGIGDRDGPKIYPRSYHAILYTISYQMIRDKKPRRDIDLNKWGESRKVNMINPFRLSMSTFIMLALMAGTTLAQHTRSDFRELENVVSRELKETNTPGASVAIVSGDRVVFSKGFGVSSVETGAPVTPDMLFRVGSLTKMLTAAVLVSLAEEGKIALNEPVGDFVRGLDPLLARLTAHQLLSHSAGLIDFAHTCCAQDESALAAEIRGAKAADFPLRSRAGSFRTPTPATTSLGTSFRS